MVVPGSRTSSLRPKVFLVPRLAYYHSRCCPLRSHYRPRQLCVASISMTLAARHLRRATHASQSQKSTSRPTYSRLTSSLTANATMPVFLVTLVHSCAYSSPARPISFLPLLNTLRIKLSSRPCPPPPRPQTYPRCHLTTRRPVHLRCPLPLLTILSRPDIL